MNAELKKKWAEALRSGRYEQSIGMLYQGEKKDAEGNTVVCCCALGVLNDISGLGHWSDDGYVVYAECEFGEDLWNDGVCEANDGSLLVKTFLKRWDSVTEEADIRLPDFERFRKGDYPEEILQAIDSCFLREEEVIHHEVAAFADIVTSPKVVYRDEERNIHELNDAGVPFSVIANLIEEQL